MNHTTIAYTNCDDIFGESYHEKMYGEFSPTYTFFEDVHLTGCRQIDGWYHTYVGGFVAYTFGATIFNCSNAI